MTHVQSRFAGSARSRFAPASHIHSFHKKLSQDAAVAANGLQRRRHPMEISPELNREYHFACGRILITGAGCVSQMINTCGEQKQDTAAQVTLCKRMLNTNPEPLNAINVGINNDEGPVNRVMSLKKLASVGCVGQFWRRRV